MRPLARFSRRRFVELVTTGVRAEDIAVELGVSRATVFRHARTLGLRRRLTRTAPDREAKLSACDLWLRRRMRPSDIAKELGVHVSTVHRSAARYGIELKRIEGDTPPPQLLQTMLTEEGAVRAVADALGLRSKWLMEYMDRTGLVERGERAA
jgi:transposase